MAASLWAPTNSPDSSQTDRVVLLINWWDEWLLYWLTLWLTGWLKAGSLSSWLIGCGMQQVVENLNGFCSCVCVCAEICLCACVCVSECMFFFPWLKPLSLSADPQISFLIWHFLHSQFPALLHDSSVLCWAWDCRQESATTACLSLTLSTLLELLFLLADEYIFLSAFCHPVFLCLYIWLHILNIAH